MTPTIGWVLLSLTIITSAQNILEDARVHPTSDGSFGFLYRTQDGIAHAAKGDPGGAVHGRFTYTDPTGLKVNFNYNAGAQARAQKAQQVQSRPQERARYLQNQEDFQDPPNYPQERPAPRYEEPRYEQPAPKYQPRPKAPPQSRYQPDTYEPIPRRSRPNVGQNNVNTEYNY